MIWFTTCVHELEHAHSTVKSHRFLKESRNNYRKVYIYWSLFVQQIFESLCIPGPVLGTEYVVVNKRQYPYSQGAYIPEKGII